MPSFEELKKKARQRQAQETKQKVEADKAKEKTWETIKASARSAASVGVDERFINTFLTDAQNYLKGANSAYTGMGYANRESVFTSQKKTADDLRSRSGKIRAYLNGNKSSMKEDDYNSLVAMLDDFDKSAASIYDAFSKKNEGISQFASEYAYTEFLRQNELEGMTADELQAARGSRVSDEDKGIIHELMLSNMPYSREYAQQDGVDMALYDDVERKRKYIGDKYGVDLSEDIYNNGKILTDLLNDDVIAYTTMDGRNVTWDSLLQNAQQSEDLANRLSTYSVNADWAEKSKKIQTVADTESDYSIVYEVLQSLVPYDWKTAEANGIDRETFDAIERKRRYISEKYGVDLYSDIYSNFDTLSNILAQLDGQEGEKETFENISYLTSEEKAVLSYIYETEGRAAALAWHNSRMNLYDERFRGGVVAGFKGIGKDSPFWGSVGSVALSLGSGIEYLGDIFDYMATGELDRNTMALASSSIRSGVMENTNWEIGNWDAFDFIYGTGMSGVDSLVASTMGGNVGGAFLGLSAAAQATKDALDKGMSNGQAFLSGAASGVFEGLFEKWSIGNFNALKAVASANGRDIAKNIAKSMLTNASEETLTEAANIVYDLIINGDFSQYETLVRQYVVSGMTESEAKKKAAVELGLQIAEAGASGALMGLGFGAAGSGRAIAHNVASSAQSAQQTFNIGKQIRDAEGGIDALSSLAAEVAGADSKLSGRAKNLNGDVATGTGLGKIVAGAKNMGRNWKTGQVYRGVESSVADQTKTDVAAALQNAGLSERSAKHLADAVVANMNGKQLTNFQRSTLELYEGNEKIENAISQAVSKADGTVHKNAQSMDSFAKDIAAGRISRATGISLDVAKEYAKGNHNAIKESLAESSYEVSAEGKTIDKNGNEIKITGVESIKDGKLILKTENGTVDANEVSFATEEEAFVYSAVSNMDVSAESAWALIKGFDNADGVSAKLYAIDMPLAYKYGLLNYKAGLLKLSLTDRQAATAFQMGRTDAERSVKETAQASTEGTVSDKNADKKIIFEGFTYNEKTAKEVQKASMAAIDVINKMSSLEVHVYKSYKKNGKFYAQIGGKERLAPNGYFTDGNKIYIDLNAGNHGEGMMLFTMAHEIGHYIAEYNAADFKAISDFLFEHYGEDAPIYEELRKKKETLIESYKRDGKPVPEKAQLEKEAQEELVCDMLSRMLADQHAYDKLMELKKENLNAFQKLGEAIKKFLDKIAKFIGIYDSQVADFQMAASVETFGEEAFRQLQDLYIKAFVQADANFQAAQAQKNTTEDGGVKYMARDGMEMMSFVPRGRKVSADLYIEERHGLLLEDIRKHLPELQNMTPVCDLDGTEFQKNESDTRSLKQKVKDFFDGIGNKVVRKELGIIALNNAGAQDSVEHGYGPIKAACFAALPAVLEKGLMFGPSQYLERGHDTYLFVAPVRFVGVENGEFFVGAYVIKDVNTTRYKIHEVLTISKEGNRPFQPEADQNGERLRDDSLPASTVAQTDPIVNTESTQAMDVEVDEKTESVIPSVLMSDRDSIGNQTETQQFKRWFGDWQNHPDKASKVVNADGTPKVMYHGSPAQFTIFDKKKAKSSGHYGRGFYFTDSQSHASTYGQQYSVYLNIKSPLQYGNGSVSRVQVRKFLEAVAENEDYSIENYGSYDVGSILDVVMGKKGSIDAFQVIQDISATAVGDMVEAAELFNKVNGTKFDGIIAATETVAFYPEQIKSATDNIGTFDGSNPDIRYSDRDYSYEALTSKPDMVVTTVGGNVPNNRADVVHQAKKNAAKVGKFNPKDGSVSVHVDDIDADVVVGTAGLKHSLDRRFNVNAPVTLQAGLILQNSIQINELTPQHPNAQSSYVLIGAAKTKDGQLYIVRSVVNRFSQELTSMDVLYAFNGKTEPDLGKKKETGRETIPNGPQLNTATITGSTISIAELLDHVNQYFPDILPEDVLKHYGYDARPEGDLGPDALYQERTEDSVSNRSLLASAFEGVAQNEVERSKIQEYRGKVALMDAEEKKLQDLNAQIKELSFAKGPRDTKKIRGLQLEARQTANRISTYDKQLLRLEASKPLQDVLAREKKAAYKRAEQKGKEALEAYREKALKQQKDLSAKYQESRKTAVAKARETAEKRDARAKLQKLVLDTVKWISYPAKTDVKCPDILKKPYEAFLKGIDLSSKRLANGGEATNNDLRLANAMDSLATAIDRVMLSQDPSQEVDKVLDIGYLDLPADFVQKLRDMTESIKAMMVEGEYVVNTMTAVEVRQLSQMIRTLNHAIKTMGKLYANLRFANVEALGFDTMDFLDTIGEIEKTGGMKDFVEWDNALPYYAFKRFGKGGESIFDGLMDAQDKLAFLAQGIFDFQEKTWTGEEAKVWSEDTHTIDLPNGNKLTLTTADAMSIYCLSRREQALPHLLGGGIRVMGIQKGSQKAKDSRSLLAIEDVETIISSLTDRQKQVAEAVQEFMSTVCSEWGNEISMKRFLTREFTEKFYFPIESNDENLTVKDPAAQQSDLFRLLNISATKPLTQGANNEVIIRNIFDVFTGHASDMARLNAYGMGLLDYMKWLNYRERGVNEEGQINVKGVRKSMEKAYGKAANSYVLNLIKDVNGRASDGGDPTILMKWMRAAKTASVGSSLRVAALQITSYPRAALVLSPKSLALGLTKMPNINRAKKYCGIALWKSFGFYDTNISRSIEDQMKGVTNVKQKLIELSLKGAEWGDAITWGALWNACEYEVAQTTTNKVGSEEFYQEVGKKLREVIYRTQVVDSTLTRSQIMRSKRGMAQEAAAFMSEPTLSANILMDAGFEFGLEKRRTGSVKKAWEKTGSYIGRAVAVYSIGQLTAALMEALWDAWRDDEDEEFSEKYLSAFVENLVLDLVPFNKLPIVSDVFEGALSLFGVGFYSSDKMSTTWLTQAVSAVDTWKKVFSGESSATAYNALYKTVRAISSFFGISISGVMREGVALWNNTAGVYDSTLKIRQYEPTKAELGSMLLDAIISGNVRQADNLKAEFADEETYRSAIRSAIKDRYDSGELDYDNAKRYLVEYSGIEADDAHWKVEGWEHENDTGEEFAKYGEFFAAVETGKNLKAVIKKYTDNGVSTDSLKAQIANHFKPLYIAMSTSDKADIKGYLLNAYIALGYDRGNAADKIAEWEFEADYPELDGTITYSQYKRWKADGKPHGVSIEMFVDVASFRDDGTSNSVKSQDEVAQYISTVTSNRSLRNALWCCFYKASTSPWR